MGEGLERRLQAKPSESTAWAAVPWGAGDVVVGTDDSGPALTAVAWAAGEARLRGRCLRTVRLSKPVATHLLREGSRASVIVVGTRGRSEVAARLFGSVSDTVAAHATCPVVVVRPRWSAGPPAQWKPVVVGVKADEHSAGGGAGAENRATVAFAATEAGLRGMPLHILSACSLPARAGVGVAHFQGESMSLWAARQVAEALEAGHAALQWAEAAWPGLQVSTEVEQRPAMDALVACSPQAQLLVLGAGRRAGRLGPISRAVLHHAACPVAVVPRTGRP